MVSQSIIAKVTMDDVFSRAPGNWYIERTKPNLLVSYPKCCEGAW
jgi:hypothetical protein